MESMAKHGEPRGRSGAPGATRVGVIGEPPRHGLKIDLRTLTIKQRGLFRILRLGGMPPRMAYETAKSFTPDEWK